jgi:hypothetical protein
LAYGSEMGSTHLSRLCGSAAVSAVVLILSCGKDEPPGCRVAQDRELPVTALTSLADVSLQRAGNNFVLVGTESGGDKIRFATLMSDGTLGAETVVNVPQHAAGPWAAVTGKGSPGDQLAVVYAGSSASSPGRVELDVITMDSGGSAASGPKPLLDSTGMPILLPPTATAPTELRASMGTSKTGMLAAFTWRYDGQSVAPKLAVIKPGGDMMGPPTNIQPPKNWDPKDWDCLALVSTHGTDFAVTGIQHPQGTRMYPSWYISEVRADGSIGFTLPVELVTRDLTVQPNLNCPMVAPTEKGYTIAWQNTDGTYFGDMDASAMNGNVPVNVKFVKGAVRFGGPEKQPPVVCVANMKSDIAIAYAANEGPQVDRFDVFGSPQGGSLFLPSHGRPGQVSSWPTVGSFYLTYLDMADSSKPKRYLIQVDCPPRT